MEGLKRAHFRVGGDAIFNPFQWVLIIDRIIDSRAGSDAKLWDAKLWDAKLLF